MDGDPLTFDKNLDSPTGEANLDLGTSEAVGNAVEVLVDLDVIIDADPADTPLRKDVRVDRQRLELGPIEFFEQLPARAAKPAQRLFLIEPFEQLGDRRIELGKAVEPPMARRAKIHRSTTSTATSTLALSRGRPGRVGSTAVP